MQRIELNGEEEPVWLTPYLRDIQPDGERDREKINTCRIVIFVGLTMIFYV